MISGHVIRMIRDEWMVSQAEFARLVGVSREWVVLSEKLGDRRIRRKTLNLLAERMGVSSREAMSLLFKLNRYSFDRKEREGVRIPGPITPMRIANGERYEPATLRAIPFYDVSLPASGWIETEPRDRPDGDVQVPLHLPRDAFALRIFGDCMEPEYPSGSIIVFVPIRPGEDGAAQFEEGKDYYFEHSDGKATFKRVFFEASKQRFKLVPLNKRYKPFYVPEQMRARLSRAVRLVREL